MSLALNVFRPWALFRVGDKLHVLDSLLVTCNDGIVSDSQSSPMSAPGGWE